ncbi:MAG: HEAT repeat domain-containing protein [Armatimonadetes bacterium]|nr:HEAT repeat domain-containing protein [Armatimonadota bacterium]
MPSIDIGLLLRELSRGSAARRRAAAEALGRAGDLRAIEPLTRAETAADPGVRRAVARALAALRECWAGNLAAAMDHPEEMSRHAAAVQLARIGAPAVRPLVAALRNRRHQGRCEAASVLGRIGGPGAVEGLVDAAAEGDAPLIRAALDALAQLPYDPLADLVCSVLTGTLPPTFVSDPRAVPVLLRVLNHPFVAARCAAVEALGRLEDRRATPGLVRALSDGEPAVQCAAARALGVLRDRRAVPALARVLETGAPAGPLAADALGYIGDPAAVPPLVRSLRSDGPCGVRLAAARALGNIGLAAAPALGALKALAAAPGMGPTPEERRTYKAALERIEATLRAAPAELEAASAPAGTGVELEAGPGREGASVVGGKPQQPVPQSPADR